MIGYNLPVNHVFRLTLFEKAERFREVIVQYHRFMPQLSNQ